MNIASIHLPTTPRVARETELKYAVSAASWEALLRADRLGRFTLEPGQTVEVHDVYADTRDRAISAAGFAFRIRRNGGERVACLKSLGSGGGVGHSREEYECAIESPDAPEDWPDGETRTRFLAITAGRPVQTAVEIHQTRFKRFMMASGARVAEVSLDEVGVTGEDGRDTFLELEIELLTDELLADLETLHDGLMATYDLEPVETSKFERAMGLVANRRSEGA